MCELPEVACVSNPTARKNHKCCECEGTIAPGDRYQVYGGLWDRRWRTFKTCEDCLALRNDIASKLKPAASMVFGSLSEWVFEARNQPMENVFIYMNIRRKRNAPESPNTWMERLEARFTRGAQPT